MKPLRKVVIGLVGLSTLSGCNGDVDGDVEMVQSYLFAGLAKGVRRDYNGDGKEDAIIRNTSGSYEYLGASPSGWTPDAWVRTDLTSQTADYVYGDFNGDGESDVIITTASGSYEYTGNVGGGFMANVWTSTALTRGNVEFTVGDFNGDNRSDLIVTRSSGSALYTGKSTGGFNTNVWTSSGLTKGNVRFTRGNFNGDSTTDLIVTTATGSSEYTGQTGTGGFNVGVWTSSAFVLNSSRFVAADFNGDLKGDFLVQTFEGAHLYTGRSPSGFNADVWANSGSPYDMTASTIFPGEFSGDGKWDFLLCSGTEGLGTLEFLGSSSGNMTPVWIDTRFHLYDTVFYRGDYNGDGEDDFVAVHRDLGTFESTGINGGGFNSDVWVRPDLNWTNSTSFN